MNFAVALNNQPLAIRPARVSAFMLNRVWNGRQRPLDQTQLSGFVSFDLAPGKNVLEVCWEESLPPETPVEIRPLAFEAPVERLEKGLRITLDHPCQFTVEVGGRQNVLHIFANPPFVHTPEADEIYFGPGEHHPGVIMPRSGQRVCIDAGAVVYGAILLYKVENVRIDGRGVLDSSLIPRGNDFTGEPSPLAQKMDELGLTPRDGHYSSSIVAYECRNIRIEGIVVQDPPFWAVIIRNGCQDVVLDNIKLVGLWRYNADGIDICASSNTVIRNSFIRSFDDCIVARGAHLDGENQPLENMLVENCVLWCDWGKALEVWAGKYPCPIRHVVFRKCSVIHLAAMAMDITTWYGSGDTRIEDVRFQDIHVDLGECLYNQQIQSSDDERYLWKQDWQPRLLVVNCDRLGADIGNQQAGKVDDYDVYKLSYRDITVKNVQFHGSGGWLPVIIAQNCPQLAISDVRLQSVQCDRLEVQGEVQRLSWN